MAPHSSTVARKIPRMEEPGRLQSIGSLRVRHDWSDLAAAAFTSLISKSWHTRQPLAFHTLFVVDDPASPYTDRTEATHTKLSPPHHHNRAHVSPWACPPFLPLYHWDEGPLLLPMAVSPHAVFITALSLLQFRLSVSWSWVFPLCWITPIMERTALVIFHHRKNSPWTLHNPPTTTSFLTPLFTATLLGWYVYIHPLHLLTSLSLFIYS